MGQNSGLSGENGTEKKAVNNSESSPTDHLKTEKVNLSDSGAENSSLAGNYRLEALDVELKVPSYELPLNRDGISNYGNFFERIPLNESALKMLKSNGFVVIFFIPCHQRN